GGVVGFGVSPRCAGPRRAAAVPPAAGKHAVTHQPARPGTPAPAPKLTHSAATPAPAPQPTRAATTPAPPASAPAQTLAPAGAAEPGRGSTPPAPGAAGSGGAGGGSGATGGSGAPPPRGPPPPAAGPCPPTGTCPGAGPDRSRSRPLGPPPAACARRSAGDGRIPPASRHALRRQARTLRVRVACHASPHPLPMTWW